MKKYWVITAVLGGLVLALSVPVLAAFPQSGSDVPPGYGGAVFAFEMATKPSDLLAIFGPEGDPLRQSRIAQMNDGNILDYPFLISYSLFMAAFFVAIYARQQTRIWLLMSGFGILAGASDAVENLILLNLTNNLESAPFIAWLKFPVWLKFGSIALCNCAAGIYLIQRSSWAWRAVGAITIVGGLGVSIALINPSNLGLFIAPGTSIGWTAMLIFSAIRSLRTGGSANTLTHHGQ